MVIYAITNFQRRLSTMSISDVALSGSSYWRSLCGTLQAWCMTGWTVNDRHCTFGSFNSEWFQDVRSAATSRQWLLLIQSTKNFISSVFTLRKMSDSSWTRKYLSIINICKKKKERKKNYRVETIQIQKKKVLISTIF